MAVFLCAASAHADTHRILALRISFPPEQPDEETTSGDGAFDLRTFAEARDSLSYPFDAPPHDRAYFDAHLQALSNYYRAVSDGKVDIAYDVYPREATGSYILETPLIEYGNGRTRTEISERITRLFRDGIQAADRAEGATLDFSQYDAFAVFHAGLGGEASQALNDVPSAFISAQDLTEFADGPIAVSGGAFAVNGGMLLPEAISSTGRGGLNGTLARFFASQLGLPGLSDFENDLPAVGDWSLMDTGANNLFTAEELDLQPLRSDAGSTLIGFLPSRPMAWSRVRLGWVDPLVITRSDTVQIAAPHVPSKLPQIVKVPISATEYYLLENRISRLKMHNRRPQIERSDPNGVWLSVDDYDALIPGSGLLIWHIDDTVINASDETRSINSHPDYEITFTQYRRGVSLEEADGLLDIGNVSASRVIRDGIISFSRIEGGPDDPFYVGNNALFGPNTTPNTRSNLNYETGITIEALDPPGDVMRVAIHFAQQATGWPITNLSMSTVPRTVDLDGDGVREILHRAAWTLSGKRSAQLPECDFAFPPAIGALQSSTGPEWIAGRGTVQYLWREGQLDSIVTAFIQATELSAAPIIAAFPDANTDIWGWSDGRVQWGAWAPDRAGGVNLGSAVRSLAAGDIDGDGDNELIAATASNQIHIIQNTDQSRQLAAFDAPILGSPVLADLDRDGRDDIAVITSNGVLSMLDAEGIVYQSHPVPGGAYSSPVLADLDDDGFVEILFGGNGKLWIYRFNSVQQTGGPIAFPLKDEAGPIEAPPVVAHLDGDGTPEIISATRGGLIYVQSAVDIITPTAILEGDEQAPPPLRNGFVLSVPGPVVASPLLDDLDDDGALELVVFTSNGAIQLFHLEVLEPAYSNNQIIWGQLGGGPSNAGKLLQPPVQEPSVASSSALLPAGKTYVYPNPIQDTNQARIRFFLADAADVNVIVVDALGEIVARIAHSGPTPNTDNEILWDVTNYASGLYICRVEATNGNRSDVRFVKAAVIK